MIVLANAERDVARKARVFLSYSRADSDFVRRLADALVKLGYLADYDRSSHDPTNVDTGISAEDEWWKRLQEMVAAAEVVIFIVSPRSATSKVCDEEIAYSRALGKRIIPVLRAPVDFTSMPPRLAALNIKLSFVEDDAFDQSLSALAAALDVDVGWHREAARLAALAVKWDMEGRPDFQLFSAGGVASAEAWMARRPANASPPGDLLAAFLDAGRVRAAIDRERLLTITGRAFVKPAEQALEEGRCDSALRFAATGALLGEDTSCLLVPERATSAILAVAHNRLRSTLLGHDGPVLNATFSPEGAWLVTVSEDGTARVWDAETGGAVAVLRRNTLPIVSATFSPEGKRVVTACEDGTARVWDAQSGEEIAVMRGHAAPVLSATFDPEGARVVTTSEDGAARVWDAETGGEIASLQGNGGPIVKAAFSPEGTRIAAICKDAALVWDVVRWRRIGVLRSRGMAGMRCVAFSRDGARIATASNGKGAQVSVWDARTFRRICSLRAPKEFRKRMFGFVGNVSFSPDGGRVITAGAMEGVRVWDSTTGRPVVAIKGEPVANASFSPDGTRIVTVSAGRRSSGDVSARIWDAETGEQFVLLNGHDAPVMSAVFSPDGTRVVTASADGTGRVWDAALGRDIAVFRGHGEQLRCAAFSPDESMLITAVESRAQIWDVASGKNIVALIRHAERLNSASFSPDGTRVVTASEDNTARVWNVANGQLIAVLRGHEVAHRGVVDAKFSPNGALIVTASWDNTARIWDATTGQENAVLRGHTQAVMSAEFSPDGAQIITASRDGTACLWDTSTGRQDKVLHGHEGKVRSAAYSRDGRRIVTASEDATGRVWDAETGNELLVLRGHKTTGIAGLSCGVGGAAFSRDGGRIVTASWDGSARIWDASTGRELMTLAGDIGSLGGSNIGAAFNHSGTRVITTMPVLQVWDVRPSDVLVNSAAELIAASLTNSRGVRTPLELRDLLAKDLGQAYDNVGLALAERLRLAEPAAEGRVTRFAKALTRPLHPNCYLSPGVREWDSPLSEVRG